jgi:2-polyprenyl-3-methyl-5-hydroxy-6-metoxy-1,4-benzoquinol methylase
VFVSATAAQKGLLGLSVQSWIRIQKSRLAFDRLYGMPKAPFDEKPNRLLVRTVENLPPGEALDIAAGQGRNAVYLARKGWRVTAFDISAKGLAIAEQSARRSSVPLTAARSTAQDFDYGHGRWDLVALIYAPIPYEDPQLLARIRDSIKPGGLIVVDTPVLMHQPKHKSPRVPGDLDKGELPSLFPGFDVLQYTEAEEATEWFRLKLPIGRLVARKR